MTVLGKTILQGSVATRFRCGGIVSNHLTTNFWQNPSVKEFRKSVKIRQLSRKVWCSLFWDTVYRLLTYSQVTVGFVQLAMFPLPVVTALVQIFVSGVQNIPQNYF